MVSRFVKHFSDPVAAWSMPRGFMNVSYCRFSTPSVDLFIDLIAKVGSVQEPKDFTDHVFFIVVEAFPERKHVIRAPYLKLNVAEVFIVCGLDVSMQDGFAEEIRPRATNYSAKFHAGAWCSLDTRMFAQPGIPAQLWRRE